MKGLLLSLFAVALLGACTKDGVTKAEATNAPKAPAHAEHTSPSVSEPTAGEATGK